MTLYEVLSPASFEQALQALDAQWAFHDDSRALASGYARLPAAMRRQRTTPILYAQLMGKVALPEVRLTPSHPQCRQLGALLLWELQALTLASQPTCI